MKTKSLRKLSILLIFCLLLANILYEKTPVQAAGDSSVSNTETDIYKWYEAKTLDDLKQYKDASRDKTWSYKGTWMPIIIIAEYSDGTRYYMNRDTQTVEYHSDEDAVIPRLNKVDEKSTVGFILQNAMDGDSKEFYTRGDLHAMHMFYHGEVKSDYSDGYIQTEGWSLTKDSGIEDPTFGNQVKTQPSTVYGIRNHRSYVTTDQNEVLQWNNGDGLPTTESPRDTSVKFRQAWTFVPYDNNTFLISNMFSFGTKFKLSSGDTAYSLTMGCALSGTSRFSSPDEDARNYIETPSRAAATIYRKNAAGHTLSGDAAARAIIEQYEYKYDEQKTRAHFRIFVGQKEDGSQEMDNETLVGTKRIGLGNHLARNKTITVEKGAVLIVPSNSFFYLDGTIINRGTIVLGENSTVAPSRTNNRGDWNGRIQCEQGGTLLVMKNAKLALDNGLILDDASVINNGTIMTNISFYMNESQMQLEANAGLALGAFLENPSIFMQTKIDNAETWFKSFHKDGQDGVRMFGTDIGIRGEKSILMKPQSAVVMVGNDAGDFIAEVPWDGTKFDSKSWKLINLRTFSTKLAGWDYTGANKAVVQAKLDGKSFGYKKANDYVWEWFKVN